MSLPSIVQPDGTPAFLADGHAIELVPVYARVGMAQGHTRTRRIVTEAPRRVDVSLMLVTRALMAAYDDWFESALQVGALSFAAQVKHQGPGALWWAAQWLGPYHAQPLPGGRVWRLSGRLLLSGKGQTDAEAEAPA